MNVVAIGLAVLGLATAGPLKAHQETLPRLLVGTDRVLIRYRVDTPNVKAGGTLFLRSGRRAWRVRLTGKGPLLSGRVPAAALRGRTLSYHAVIRDKPGRSITLPSRSAWILRKPVVVDLGRRRYGAARAPEAVVARARPDQVAWDVSDEFNLGPQDFLVERDGSVWLQDSYANRLIAWDPGRPNTIAHTFPLPGFADQGDLAEGPDGTLYSSAPGGGKYAPAIFRLSRSGKVLSKGTLPPAVRFSAQLALRRGPDGTLYCAVGWESFARPNGDQGWMPVATAAGGPIAVSNQQRRIVWGAEPLAGGLRLVTENVSPDGNRVEDARVAIIDRRDRVVRSWRVEGHGLYGLLTPPFFTPELVRGDPVVVADVGSWMRVVLRLGPKGAVTRFPLRYALVGVDPLYADLRVGPDGGLYQLMTSQSSGVTINRYSLDAK